MAIRNVKIILTALAAVILISFLGCSIIFNYSLSEPYAIFVRPDGHYKIVVYKTHAWVGLMPGQSGDSPGIVRLYNLNEKQLKEAKVEMVQLVDNVEWLDKKVRIKLIADWELPD